MTDFDAARHNMVESQIRPNKVIDPAVIEAFASVPRERFVPSAMKGIAYVDEDLAVGHGRYLMEPMVFARLLQAAEIGPESIVLDIGIVSGYGPAVIAQLASTVVGLESDEVLRKQAAANLEALGVDNAVLVEGALEAGFPAQAPYDVIVLEGSVETVSEGLFDQLADGGRLVTIRRVGPATTALSGLKGSALGHAVVYHRTGGVVSDRVLFDAQTPPLPGFAKPPEFVF